AAGRHGVGLLLDRNHVPEEADERLNEPLRLFLAALLVTPLAALLIGIGHALRRATLIAAIGHDKRARRLHGGATGEGVRIDLRRLGRRGARARHRTARVALANDDMV